LKYDVGIVRALKTQEIFFHVKKKSFGRDFNKKIMS